MSDYLEYAMYQALFHAGNIVLSKMNKNPCLHKIGVLVSNDRKYKISKLCSLLDGGKRRRGKQKLSRVRGWRAQEKQFSF